MIGTASSRFMFGVVQRRLSRRECERRHAIAARHGCIFVGGKLPDGWKYWFAGPNRGDPFDRYMRDRVLADVGSEATF